MNSKDIGFTIGAILIVALSLLAFSVAGSGFNPQTMSGPNEQPLIALSGSSLNQQTGNLSSGYSLIPYQSAYDPSAVISVFIALEPSGDMQAYVNGLYDPSSPYYHQFLTPSQIGNRFGVSPYVYGEFVQYFESYGIYVSQNPSRLDLYLTGTVSQFENAFHTTIQSFRYQYTSNGIWNPLFGNSSAAKGSITYSQPFYAATGDLKLPSDIEHYVSGISGLNGLFAQPDLMLPYGLSPTMVSAAGSGSGNSDPGVTYIPSINNIQNLTYANYTWATPAAVGPVLGFPSDLGNYQFVFPSTMHILTGAENLWNGADAIRESPDLGQGITVAVIEVGFPIPSDMAQFSQQVFGNPNQLPDRLTYIGVGIPSVFDGIIDGFNYGWTLETELDIEYIAAMAPMAHIDVVAVPNPEFSSFDNAYQFIAQYLVNNDPVSAIPSGNIVFGPTAGATNITITSNSYGAPEWEAVFLGSPMYVTVEDELLAQLNAVGVTNFFASGDEGSNFMAASPSMPSQSPFATSVGGGQATAESNGVEFPLTNVIVNYSIFGISIPMYVTSATGLASFTYWSYGFGFDGTFKGEIGGGFGESVMEQQPWYEAGLDVYETGALIDPIVSGPAAFNMSIYGFGTWNLFYGGTSFATPITAGEWALIEEQASMLPSATPKMGNVNPLLFEAHNAYNANVPGISNPYVDMINIGKGFNYGPINDYSWYLFNLSISEPSDPVLPGWYATLFNPAGSGWNFLQGLGFINAAAMSKDLIGTVSEEGYSLINPAFSVMMVTPSGLSPFTTLTSGQMYTFRIVTSNGAVAGSNYMIDAFSGGVMTQITPNATGFFNYTPSYSKLSFLGNATEYGYFLVSVMNSPVVMPAWDFQQFGVSQPMASGNLVLTVTNPEGVAETGTVEIPMFTTTLTGFYNTYGIGPAEVMLNGEPVASAVVSEISVNVSQFYLIDPTMPVSSYAPGVTLGHFLTDARGNFVFWTDALLAETNGTLLTQVVQLRATYDGLTSNTVTVYIEPQAGDFIPSINYVPGQYISGVVDFADMKYVNYVNISIGSMPGQYTNVSYPPLFFDNRANTTVSGISNGYIPFNFTVLPPPGQTIMLNMTASGINDLSVSFSFFGFTFLIYDIQHPIIWHYTLPVSNPGPDPSASISGSQNGIVSGSFGISYSSSWPGSNIEGKLNVYSSSKQMILTRSGTSGNIKINTESLSDGYYYAVFTVSTPTGLSASATYGFFVYNDVYNLQNNLTSAEKAIASYSSTATGYSSSSALKSSLIAALMDQFNQSVKDLNTLQAQAEVLYSSGMINSTTYNTVQTQISSYRSDLKTYHAEIASMAEQLADSQNVRSSGIFGSYPTGLIAMISSVIIAGIILTVSIALIIPRRKKIK
ncbi:protease pro-enzyme activation domain-containing protein [Thermoplasma sp.]|uniref:S53 family peptidase n=1 Tax=Thermoplasma sp. TaxID=1973142 RepID=UPI002614E656|nr:protease pro-enzyme activation domain-containing protein [Thermoplasma sp.]